jgi:Bacterial Ig-like domain (group 3)
MKKTISTGNGAVGWATWTILGLWLLPVAFAAATVTVASNLSPSNYGQTVKLVAKVVDPLTPTSQLTGSMTYMDGTFVLGNATVSNGVASLSTRSLTGGDHLITATFLSTTTGGPEVTSSPITQHVNLGVSTTTISTTNANVYNGRTGSIKAKVKAVSPAFGVPTGWVDFYLDPYDPNNPVGSYLTATLDATGTALFDFAYLYGPGTYSVTAVYSGDTNFDHSVSSVLSQTVLLNAPTALASFSPTMMTVGGSARLTVSVKNPTPYAMQSVALGVMPQAPFTVVSTPAGAVCGARPGLYYCMISVPAGATRSLVLQMTPGTNGTITANSYARNIDTSDETGATAVLTVQ